MNKCPKCYTQNAWYRDTCSNCGNYLVKLCPNCGAVHLYVDKYCKSCDLDFTQDLITNRSMIKVSDFKVSTEIETKSSRTTPDYYDEGTEVKNVLRKNQYEIEQSNYSTGIILASKGNHNLAIREDGSLWVWGNNEFGQLGDGTRKDVFIPKKIIEDSIVGIAAGERHCLAIRNDGSLWAWGINFASQFENDLVPQKTISAAQTISIGMQHSLVKLRDGALLDFNDIYTIRSENVTENTDYFVKWVFKSGVIDISAGAWHSLALREDGSLWSWGSNFFGQLGDGKIVDSKVPQKIIESDVIRAVAGDSFNLAIKKDGSLWAWGNNDYGQIGDNTYKVSRVPKKIIEKGVIDITAGSYHSLAVMENGSLWAWGNNEFGQLGNGSNLSLNKPNRIIEQNIGGIGAGSNHSLAVKKDGSVWAWGRNNEGQLGTGNRSESWIPKKVL